MPDFFSLIWVQAVDKILQANILQPENEANIWDWLAVVARCFSHFLDICLVFRPKVLIW